VHLDTITRKDAAADFFGEENVPREAITMGVATIMDATEIVLIATGEHKAAIIRRAAEGEISRDVAATFLQEHGNTTFYVDGAASSELTRVRTPWLLREVEWTEALTDRAVIWLSNETHTPILKLSRADYAEKHLSALLAQWSSVDQLNKHVFGRLAAKIRDNPGLPQHRRVIVFSPHPDDDVISMGGTLRKLHENENSMVVAYMTSGNIAVFDHEVRRYLDFMGRFARDLGVFPSSDGSPLGSLAARVESSFAGKEPGDVDIPEVQDVKREIREAEAVSAVESLGIPRAACRFLNLPFYQTGKVRKDPVGPADVEIILQLFEEVRPEVIFVAGDLSDPHGTHRQCKQAIEWALSEYRGPRPEVWLYRGAWQEWPVHEADVLVPVSREELRKKILAIFKHQSQKDVAPFPGAYDEREFWQRVEARNTQTAHDMDALGLPEFHAVEAFVVVPAAAFVEDAFSGGER
jgi:glucosamine-6-phosphate deaminase